jgi:hypothetical protein
MLSGFMLPEFESPYFLHRQSQEVQGLCHNDRSERRTGVTNQKA